MTERKKKVFICITKSNWGGAQKYVYDIATSLPKDSFDVSVLLGGDGELKKRLDLAGIRTVLLKHSQRDINMVKVFLLGFSLIGIFWKERPDIVHLNSSQMGGSGGFAARLTGVKKIIFTGHGWAFNEDRPWWQKILARFFHILTILLSHKTIAVSQITKDQIGKPWNKKMIVIRNGLQPIDFKDKQTARKELGLNISAENPIWIGTISELHKTKGLDYAIQAIAKIPENIIFVVIGEGEDRKRLEALIRDLHLTDKVFLLGRIASASSFLKAFDIFTLTSITEALPYAILEAGLAGLPVIATSVGGIPEIIKDRTTGILIRPKNPGEIARAVEYLLHDQDRLVIFGHALQKKIEREFDIKKMVEKTIVLYEI